MTREEAIAAILPLLPKNGAHDLMYVQVPLGALKALLEEAVIQEFAKDIAKVVNEHPLPYPDQPLFPGLTYPKSLQEATERMQATLTPSERPMEDDEARVTSRRLHPGHIPGPGGLRIGMVFEGHGKQRVRVISLKDERNPEIVHVQAGRATYRYLRSMVEEWPLAEGFVTDD